MTHRVRLNGQWTLARSFASVAAELHPLRQRMTDDLLRQARARDQPVEVDAAGWKREFTREI